MKYTLDVIILSNTINDKIYQMNCDCIKSLIDSEKEIDMKIYLIESCKSNKYAYPFEMKIIIPEEDFNYNKFMNIGIQSSSSEYIALCNNDILFFPNWFSEITAFHLKNRHILSFSPFDPSNKFTSQEYYREPFVYYGYGVRKEIAGWCIVVKRELLKIIGLFDETFDFYYVDDDYGMTLRKHAQKHVLLTTSKVIHLGGKNTKETKLNAETNTKIPCNKNLEWLGKNPKALEGHIKFHRKWGNVRKIAMKNKFFSLFPFLNIPTITNNIY